MRHKTIQLFLFTLTLLAFGSVTESVKGQEPPSVRVQANAPGWITVLWEHTGQDVYYFVIERQDAPYTDSSVFLIAQSENRTDSVTDKNLKADTLYKYHVCAVYADHRTCSDWVSAKTLSPPPPPPSSGGSSGGAPPPPAHPPIRTPDLTATSDHPLTITLHWGDDQSRELKNIQLFRNGQVVYDYQKIKEEFGGGSAGPDYRDVVPRANTKYTYKVCFISLYYIDDTKCSAEITASGKPVAPTAPASVTVSQNKSTGNPRDLTARIRTFVTAHWRNATAREGFIPGQLITLEREDRVQLDRLRVGPAWVEIKQISAAPNPNDPTEIIVDVTPEGPELLTQRGNNYHVCAVVPVLGAAGKVCSAAVIAEMSDSPATPYPVVKAVRRAKPDAPTGPTDAPTGPPRSICDVAREARARNSPATSSLEERCRASGETASVPIAVAQLDDLATKGEVLANQDPLALELRNRQQDDPSRRGFDIGMAAAEGQTAPGPGKQRIHDALSPQEQAGFDIAVSFSLERNRNAKWATIGAAIAAADPIVAEARAANPDIFYWLGFDIATGIFGDPALGAQGNTALGPGSLKIRDSLSAAGQRGFDAAVKLHLSRNYRP